MVECLGSYEPDESDVGSLLAGKMQMRIRNSWEMGIKCWLDGDQESGVNNQCENGAGAANSGADCACEAWLKQLSDTRGKPTFPALSICSSISCADQQLYEPVPPVTVGVLSLLMLHRVSVMWWRGVSFLGVLCKTIGSGKMLVLVIKGNLGWTGSFNFDSFLFNTCGRNPDILKQLLFCYLYYKMGFIKGTVWS